MIDLEEVWRIREEVIYPNLFGPVSRGIFVLDQELFDAFGISDPDPRWLMHGVLEFAPTENRSSWLYVTSGHSNPWDVEPADYREDGDSGAGVEFVLETDRQGSWAIVHLRRLLALELLLDSGRIGNGSLGLHDRIPLKAPIDGVVGHLIEHAIVVASRWPEFRLPSGEVMFVQFLGVTDAEKDFAKERGAPALIDKLTAAAAFPVIVPDRASVI
ncbi:MAG: suppressor of fused domain protein [Silicimonas sp.]